MLLQQLYTFKVWFAYWPTAFTYVIRPDICLADDDLAGECGDEAIIISFI
jgi:hypothetical protein